MKMKICLVNMDISWKNKEENIKKIQNHIKEALSFDPSIDTLIFPELCTTGYLLDENNKDFAESKNDFIINNIKKIAKENNLNIIGGFIEKNEDNKPFNSAFVINKKGNLISVYQKNHLFTQGNEGKYFSQGKQLQIFEMDGWKCGIAICFDIRYPRLFETLTDNGAEAIFIISNWVQGENKYEMLKFLSKTRATENQIFVCNIDRIGKDQNTKYTGSFIIADPIGVDISTTFNEIYHIGKIEKSRIEQIRKMIPVKKEFKENYNIKID